MNDLPYVLRPAHWPPGTHQFKDRAEMMAAIEAAQEARHLAEVQSVDAMPRDKRRHFLMKAKEKRSPEMYARLREALLLLRSERDKARSKVDESLEGVLI